MEWLLVIYFNAMHGSISTERLATHNECMYVGEVIGKKSGMLKTYNFDCVQVKKLEK